MGVLPGGAGDVDVIGAKFLVSAAGNGNQSVSTLDQNDQATVNAAYQSDLGGGQSVFSNPTGPLGQLFGGIAGLPDAFAQLVGRLLGINGPFNTIGSVISQVEHGIISGIQNALNAAIAFVQNIIDAIISILRGIPIIGGLIPDLQDTLTQHTSVMVANSAAIADLTNANDGKLNGGISSVDELERINASGVGPGYNETYSIPGAGFYAIADGHQAAWVDEGNLSNTARFIRTDPADAKTQTLYQKVGRVIGTIAGEGINLGIGTSSVDSIYCRVSDDEKRWVRADIKTGPLGNTIVSIVYQNATGAGTLGSLTIAGNLRNAAASYYLIAGTTDDLMTFQVVRGLQTLISVADELGVTEADPVENLGWGWGGQSGSKLLGQSSPSSVARVTIADNAPGEATFSAESFAAPPDGGTFRACYAGDAPETADGPAAFWVQNYAGDDMHFDAATGTLTVDRAGTYAVNVQFGGSTGQAFLYCTPTFVLRRGNPGAALSALVKLPAGGTLLAGGTLTGITGDGSETFFEVTLVNS